MVQNHDVFVAKALYCREKSSLICIHEGFDLVFRDENVALFLVGNIGGMSLVGSVILVERNPWRSPRMCPFCVSSDSGKYFATFFTLMSVQER